MVKASTLLLCDNADTEIDVINGQRTEIRDGCFLLHTSYPGACFSALASISLGLLFTRPAGEITSHLLVRTTFCHICQGDKGVKNRRFPPFFSLNCTYLLSLVNYRFCLWHLSRSDLLCSQSSSTEPPTTPCDLWVESIHEALINKTEGVRLCDRWIIPAV